MLVTHGNLEGIFDGFNMAFNEGFGTVQSLHQTLATKVNSSWATETYAWMDQIPDFREWIGPRLIHQISASGYTIKNRDFEQTISVPRNDFEDDRYGVYAPLFTQMGQSAAQLPDKLLFELLSTAFAAECYDGQSFFDTDHPVKGRDGEETSVSNMQAGAGEPWFLLDTSRFIKPFIYQERRSFGQLVAKNQPQDDNVFNNKEFIYGSDGRGNVGFGLWQLAFGSKADLTQDNYEAARAAMMKVNGDQGRPLGITPTVLVVGPDNDRKGRKILKAATGANGATNESAGSAELIVSPLVR
ncbi:Mu-like prophage major head subunit gpT family protein [Paradevosia shaoguanensis]|uniref:Mu-like prophage major head subunit gpT family protein n=1 Tax=Paradevosia shaoguanensis TaxID=1335043 RepID=A0AA41U9T9_9HYPH|nr:Mu-like prophage major head subunit gpT family protein [Paradevosia shaoguanensis]MCF1741257.1 Mu-like prophage major head subunit gpT family protein [Paradevosia shaoguanensis]MCI0125740.1 Mu-like prophage major head subunit gpT family protein [Paradevosia shaoguanensis]